MRVKNKIRILELIETINEGIEYSKLVRGEEAVVMLKNCITAVEYIGKFDSKGNLFDICKIIKEKIDCLILEINNQFEKTYIELKNTIEELEDIIINKIETKMEIVFMPYKVSMWDSMESIWEAAKEDKNCNCNVVPIPYFQLNAQGQAERVCYEGEEFSKDIDIVYFEDYKLDLVEPDIVYIHNPYDNYNRLTMVCPDFFSSNLTKYTDMLVYVPYFVDGSYESIQSHKLMSSLPGALNSNKIIVQSEVQRKLYRENGISDDKLILLGSPKIDATLKSLKKQYDKSAEWRTKIRERKVFLLAVGISDLLAVDNWLGQIETLIEYIGSRQEECVLIWRPHPLTETTLKAMRLNLLEKYKKLINMANNKENIIIDSENDVYTSMQVSDALISDYSSILFQYLATEKPVLSLMNKDMIMSNRYYNIDYRGCYFVNNGNKMDEFVDLVISGNDYKKSERIERFKNSIKNIDGTCGEKVHKKITSEYMEGITKYKKGDK